MLNVANWIMVTERHVGCFTTAFFSNKMVKYVEYGLNVEAVLNKNKQTKKTISGTSIIFCDKEGENALG